MNEFENKLELEPDQEALRGAWKDLAEVLVLKGEEIRPMGGELPATANGQQPYVFTHFIDKAFVHDTLLDDKSHSVSSATVNYMMPHRPLEEDNDVYDRVSVRWRAHMQGTDISIDHAVVISRASKSNDEQYEGYADEAYVELLPNGKERSISKAGHEYSQDNPRSVNIEHALQDDEDNERPISFEDIENIHAVAAHLRSLKR